MSEQPTEPTEPIDLEPAELQDRPMDTLEDTGPHHARHETPRARQFREGGHDAGRVVGGQEEAEHERPRFSDVAHPGAERLWWHTVETAQPEPRGERAESRGMFTRLHDEHPRHHKHEGKHHKHKHKHKGKGKGTK